MRRHYLLIGFLSILLCMGLWTKIRFFPTLTRETIFYFYSLFWISGLLIIVFIIDLMVTLKRRRKDACGELYTMKWPNRRTSYRIVYPKSERPRLIIEQNHGSRQRQLEYPVSDISEQGICFFDNGSLGPMRALEGLVRFNDGETHRISGFIVRRTSEFVCVQLHSGIPWKKILDEQRHLISEAGK